VTPDPAASGLSNLAAEAAPLGVPLAPELATEPETGALAEQRIAVATQWQLMWWRFRKHKLAVGGTIVLARSHAQLSRVEPQVLTAEQARERLNATSVLGAGFTPD
jgi:peptide/nickel transport system permease protein